MRLKAREFLTYAGRDYPGGFIFDATEADARDLISQDLAVPFRLEDPSTLPDEGELPDEEPPEEPQPEPHPAPAPEPEYTPWTKKPKK